MKRLVQILLLLLILFGVVRPALAQDEPLKVFYDGPEGSVKTALILAEYTLVDDAAQADVIVLNGTLPDIHASASAGLVIILGEDNTQAQLEEWLGIPLQIESQTDPVSPTALKGLDDPLLTEIIWNGAPQVRDRFQVVTPISSVQPLVIGYEDGEWLLWQAGQGKAYIVNAFLDGYNPQFQEWPYFNYLIYHLVERAAGRSPQSFSDYPASPVPHSYDRGWLVVVLGGIFLTVLAAFVLVRRYSLKHPEALDALVVDRQKFQAREADTNWDQVGFHRPLSGLLVGMTTGVLLFIPLIVYQNLIIPQFILPSAQALGIWGRVTQFFGMAWALFDLGTAAASMKYLSQYRVSDPRKGIQYMQVYVWWQALSGALQVAVVVLLASTGVVNSPYALFTWSIIIHSLIQLPGFYGVIRNTLNGLQRTDYARYLDNLGALVLPMLVQPVFVTLFYLLGKANPSIGAVLGGVIGLGISAYMIELLLFLVGMWLFRRLGMSARVLFLAHFDWQILKETFSFGIFEMLGSLIISAGAALEIWITQYRLINYTEIWGNWGLAQNFIFAFTVSTNLYDGTMPAISEAISNGKKKLCQYYSVQSYKWGALTSAFLAAVLLAIAPRFILGASGPDFERAARYVIPLILFGSLQYLTWSGDSILLGANRPRIRAVMILMEQVIRILLIVLLLPYLQVTGLVVAYLVGILFRGVVTYFVNNRVAFPQKFFIWQSAVAPLLALGLHFFWLNGLASLIWQGDEITSLLLFLIGLLFSLPVFMFIYSLVGGWDSDGLSEFQESKNMTGILRKVIDILIWKPMELGARLSPLTNRFPISIYQAAQEEAAELTLQKVKL